MDVVKIPNLAGGVAAAQAVNVYGDGLCCVRHGGPCTGSTISLVKLNMKLEPTSSRSRD